MKLLKVKVLTVAVAAAIYGMSLIPVQATGETPVSVKIEQEKTNLQGNLAAVKFHRQRIETLENKYCENKKAGRDEAAARNKRELIRARGELEMANAYVKADKMMIINRHNLAIDAHKAAIKESEQKLADSKTKLDRDIKDGKEDAVDNDAVAVVRYQKEVERHKEALHRQRTDKNSDILAINKDIKKANGEFSGSAYAENAVAFTYNWAGR